MSGSPDAVWNSAGDRTFANFNTQLSLEFLNYWRTSVRLQFDPWYEDDRLTRGGPMARTPGSFDARVNLNSDGRRPVVFGGNVNWGFDDGASWHQSAGVNMNWRFDETIQLRIGPSYSRRYSEAQYVQRVSDPLAAQTFGNRYVFAGLDRTTFSLDTTLNVTFSPTLSLQLYVEPFISTGRYEGPKEFRAPNTFEFLEYGVDVGTVTRTADGGYDVDPDGSGAADSFTVRDRDFSYRSLLGNAVLRWEWRPGSTIFLVWQQRRINSVTGHGAGGWVGDFDFGRDTDDMFSVAPDNVLMVKVNYWLNP